MTTEEVFEEYGDEPLFFSHYYNFIFVYKSARLDNGDQVFLHLGGNMEKVSALVVDEEAQRETKDKDGHPMANPSFFNCFGEL